MKVYLLLPIIWYNNNNKKKIHKDEDISMNEL